jgi:hypothetical protein
MAKAAPKQAKEATPVKEEMLTAGKIAEKFDLKPAQIKKAIEKLGIEPDMKKGPCAYYSMDTAQKIKKAAV